MGEDRLAEVIRDAYEVYGDTSHPWDFAANNVRALIASALDDEQRRWIGLGYDTEARHRRALFDGLRATLLGRAP